MNLRWPQIPAWLVVTLAAVIGAGALGAEVMMGRHAIGPPLEGEPGFYAGAGFGAATLVLLGAWMARFLRP